MSKLIRQMGQKMTSNLGSSRNTNLVKEEEPVTRSNSQDGSVVITQNYLSYDDVSLENESSRAGEHKGFSTSMNSMFKSEKDYAVDCCSIAWFGILQADRNQHIISGANSPSFFKRLLVHFLIPAILFMAAGMSAMMIRDPFLNQLFVWVFFLNFLIWIVTGCLKGRAKRILARKQIIWKFSQTKKMSSAQTLNLPSLTSPPNLTNTKDDKWDRWYKWNTTGPYKGENIEHIQSSHDLACASSCLGFYASDLNNEREDNQFGCFQWITWLCCGKILGRWIQCCGCCAIAQESREIEMLLPKQYIDYITFEPFVHYVNKIRALRVSKELSFARHTDALSRLSIRFVKLVKVVVVLSILIGAVGTFLHASFSFGSTLVFWGILMQSLILLYIIYWRKNAMNISLDAVIKYFACGFFICSFLTVVFESIVHYPIEIILNFILQNNIVTDIYTSISHATTLYTIPSLWSNDTIQMINALGDVTAKVAFMRRHAPIMVIYLVVKAYLTAALVEELCKYFSYKMLEHPDFLSEEELINATNTTPPSRYSSNIEQLNEDDSDDDSSDDDIETEHQIHRSYQQHNSDVVDSSEIAIKPTNSISILPGDHRNVEALASATTVAMCSVALGFACFENMIYIYFYTPPFLSAQLLVLLVRSLFPIHPISAAIQSVYVCRRDIEKDSSITLIQTVFPSVLYHGSYDFVIMLIGFIQSMNNFDNLLIFLISLSISFIVMLMGLFFYFSESTKQMERLKYRSFE